jgi:SAM-dependent methyltransferase
MRQQFSIFRSHLDLAHQLWERLLRPGDNAIDATCGNGYDTLKLSELIKSENDEKEGTVFSYDIQKVALEKAKEHTKSSQVKFIHSCHSDLPNPEESMPIRLIVYNLGYLPGGDKSITTMKESTIKSIQKAMSLIAPGGAISITCYPGHAEGAKEETLLQEFVKELPAKEWNCCFHQWLNREQSPSLFFLQKANDLTCPIPQVK